MKKKLNPNMIQDAIAMTEELLKKLEEIKRFIEPVKPEPTGVKHNHMWGCLIEPNRKPRVRPEPTGFRQSSHWDEPIEPGRKGRGRP